MTSPEDLADMLKRCSITLELVGTMRQRRSPSPRRSTQSAALSGFGNVPTTTTRCFGRANVHLDRFTSMRTTKQVDWMMFACLQSLAQIYPRVQRRRATWSQFVLGCACYFHTMVTDCVV